MTRLLQYKCTNSISELGKLCYKFLKSNKSIFIRVESHDSAKTLSESFWKLYNFLPHGIEEEEFDAIQPILIGYTNLTQRDIFINFEHEFIKYSELTPKPEVFIAWNCNTQETGFKFYQQSDNGGWYTSGL